MAKIDHIANEKKTIDIETIGGEIDIARNPGEKRQPISATAVAGRPGGDQQASSISERDIQAARRRANARVIKDAIGPNS